ncbi:phage holin family protein, partial [Candidatus Gottesmanbacteria bacterium]|nr:phage holin family protein [Candidatus Gottesmanbacteria bacterium]
AIALYFTTSAITTFKIGLGADGFFITSAALSILNIIAKPIFKIILLPLNIATFGLFSWIANVAILYLLVRFLPSVSLSPWKFPGLSYHGITISSFNLNDWQTYIATALSLAIIVNFLTWISHK